MAESKAFPAYCVRWYHQRIGFIKKTVTKLPDRHWSRSRLIALHVHADALDAERAKLEGQLSMINGRLHIVRSHIHDLTQPLREGQG